jgi:hypothetical protein
MKPTIQYTRIIILSLLLVAVAVASLSYFSVQGAEKSKKELSQSEENPQETTVATYDGLIAVIPFIEFDLIKDLYLLIKFEFVEKPQHYFNNSELPYTIRFFKTLFCFVISPNAP